MNPWLVAPGYSAAELDDAQDRFGIAFPLDLLALLRKGRIPRGWDWVRDTDGIAAMLFWPLEGLLFDVENNGLWWPEWGSRPETKDERADVVGAIVGAAPKLIPLYRHRFLVAEPLAVGNPVLSVHQSDIIYYGRDLGDYLEREFGPRHSRPPVSGARRIRFWSEVIDYNNRPPDQAD